jgi:hypothetical protein
MIIVCLLVMSMDCRSWSIRVMSSVEIKIGWDHQGPCTRLQGCTPTRRASTKGLRANPPSSSCCSRRVRMIRLWPLGCIAALSVRAYRKKTLTPLGVATAIVVSSLYSIHPWGVFLVMLLSFYLTSTFFTKVSISLPN